MRTVAAGVALLLATVAGCSSDEPAPVEVGPLASSSPAVTGPSPGDATAVPSPSATAGVIVDVPEQALEGSPDGASAFANHYFASVVNGAYRTGDATAVAALSDVDCGSCANIVADVERLSDADLQVQGDRFKLAFAEAAPPEEDGSVVVDLRFSSDPYVEVDATGKVIRTEPAQVDQDAQVKLQRRGSSWVVVAIRTV